VAKSPTARSLELGRKLGYTCQVVEYYHGPSKRRRDLFGCIDIIMCSPRLGILGVQATTGSHHAERWGKATRCNIRPWLMAGGEMYVWSWTKKGRKWLVRTQRVAVMDLVETAACPV